MTTFVTAAAAAAGVGARTAVLGAAILLGQISIGWANDYVDADRDRAVGRADKPLAAGGVPADVVRRCATAALVADVPVSLAVGWRAGATHLVAVGFGWLYDVRLKETLASWLPYAVSFGLLPVIIAAALPGQPRPRLLVVGVAGCLGVAAHFANTVGDAADDAATGVRGLPQRLGPGASVVAAVALLAASSGLLVAATDASVASLVAAAIAVTAVPVAALAGSSRRATFLAVIAAAGALVVAFIVAGAPQLTGP